MRGMRQDMATDGRHVVADRLMRLSRIAFVMTVALVMVALPALVVALVTGSGLVTAGRLLVACLVLDMSGTAMVAIALICYLSGGHGRD